MNKALVIQHLRKELDKIIDEANKMDVPHFALVFHLGDLATHKCGGGSLGLVPEDQRVHTTEELIRASIEWGERPANQLIIFPKKPFNN